MKALIMALLTITALSAHAKAQDLTTVVVNDEGEHLVADSRGNTLYVFDMDKGQTTSACNAACAEVWPPYLLAADEVAALKAPLGSITRANGKAQLTYEGRPVYQYAFDRGAAADAGDGIGGVWHYIEIEQ
jgi:predicted lipoprotein with Yx(FWY)xxD motif